ncbi:trypsin-like peptidase domain-containing protein, partial [Wenzhouxiangella marina]
MSRTILSLLAALLLSSAVLAADPLSFSDQVSALSTVPVTRLDALDRQALLAEDALRETQPGVAPRFAIPYPVAINAATSGRWEAARNGVEVWRQRIHAPDARSINLAFSRYRLPEGAELHLFSESGKYRIRPFTAADNKPHGELWTPLIEGDTMVLELQVPAELRGQVELEIGSINYGYRGFFETATPRSGSCNVDVVCPEGDPWQTQINSVAVISTGGSTFCTGFMVNNVENDGTPFFMTANHCSINAGNAPSLVTYWNYQNSTCRPPGSPASGGAGDGTLTQFVTGSTFRAAQGASDFTLVELDAQPDPTWNVAYAGWDARDLSTTTGAIAVHHPSTDEKRISFENDPTTISAYLDDTGTGTTHIRVADWDLGTTEPGSSGSPLFSPEGRVIGQLHGGFAACGNDDPDWYGRMAVSWEGGGSSSTRLRDWLDPNNTGTLVIDALGSDGFGLEPATTSLSQCGFADIDVTITVAQFGEFAEAVTLSTSGTPAGLNSAFSANPVTPPGSSTMTLSNLAAVGAGNYTFNLDGNSTSESRQETMSLILADAAPSAAAITAPVDGAVGVSITPTISWNAVSGVVGYQIEIATDPGFTNVVYSASEATTTHDVGSLLDSNSTYYVRVRGSNDCGDGAWSGSVSFSTEALPGDCGIGTSPNVLYSTGFEAGVEDWTTGGTGSTWAIQSGVVNTGT